MRKFALVDYRIYTYIKDGNGYMKPANKDILSFEQSVGLMTFKELTDAKKELESKIGNMVLDTDLVLKLEIVNTELDKRKAARK